MTQPTNEFVRRIARLERGLRRVSTTPQLSGSTIEGGSLDAYDPNDNLTVIIGEQPDGTNGAVVVTGPPPPQPTLPTVAPFIEGLLVSWDGTFADSPTTVAPMDFARVDVVVGPVGFDPIATPPQGAVLSPRGGQVLVGDLVAGQTYEVALVARAITGKASVASIVVTGVPDARPAGMSQAELDQINADLAANTDAIAGVNTRVDTVETTANTAASDAAAAQTAAGQAASDAAAASTAAGEAETAATNAMNAANGKNKVVYSTGDATGTTGFVAGDTWFKRDAQGFVIAQWEYDGAAWQARTLSSAVIGNLDAAKITTGTMHGDRIAVNTLHGDAITGDTITGAKIKALAISTRELAADAVTATKILAGEIKTAALATNAVTAAKIDVGAITGLLVTGAKIETVAATDRGIKLDGATNTLRAYDSVGAVKFEVNGNSGDVLFRGKLQTATSGSRIEIGVTAAEAGSLAKDELRLYSGNAAETKYGGLSRYNSSGLEHFRMEAPKVGSSYNSAKILLIGANAAGINNAYIYGDEIKFYNPNTNGDTKVTVDGPIDSHGITAFGNIESTSGELQVSHYIGFTRYGHGRIFIDPIDYWPIFSGIDVNGNHTQKVKLVASAVQIRNSADSGYGQLTANSVEVLGGGMNISGNIYLTGSAGINFGHGGNVLQRCNFGTSIITANASGFGAFDHGLNVLPSAVIVMPASHFGTSPTYLWDRAGSSASVARVYMRNGDANTPIASGQARTVSWIAMQ